MILFAEPSSSRVSSFRKAWGLAGCSEELVVAQSVVHVLAGLSRSPAPRLLIIDAEMAKVIGAETLGLPVLIWGDRTPAVMKKPSTPAEFGLVLRVIGAQGAACRQVKAARRAV